jgi:hypothetical protein
MAGLAVTDRNHVGVEIVELQQCAEVLPLVEVEAVPAEIERRPGDHGVVGEERAGLPPVQGKMSRGTRHYPGLKPALWRGDNAFAPWHTLH